MRKNPIRYVWMALGILCLVLGTISPSNPADGSILHGNSVLLCKGFKETS